MITQFGSTKRGIIGEHTTYEKIKEIIDKAYAVCVREEEDFGGIVSDSAYPLVEHPETFIIYIDKLRENNELTDEYKQILSKVGLVALYWNSYPEFPKCDKIKGKVAISDASLPAEKGSWGYLCKDVIVDDSQNVRLGMGLGQLLIV